MNAEQKQLILDSDISALVLGKHGEFVLIRLDVDGDSEKARADEALSRGFAYCGVLGVDTSGQAAARCEPDPDAVFTMMFAAFGFARLVAGKIQDKQRSDDFARFAEGLYAPDTRP